MGRTYKALRRNLWQWAARVEQLDRRSDITLTNGVGRVAWNAYTDALAKCRANGCADE